MRDEKRTYTYSKSIRLRKRSEFVRLSRTGVKIQNELFIALYDRNTTGRTRLGITVTKRVGNAVARNQLKRYVREFYRLNRQDIPQGFDINIIVKTRASGIPFAEANVSLKNIFSKMNRRIRL